MCVEGGGEGAPILENGRRRRRGKSSSPINEVSGAGNTALAKYPYFASIQDLQYFPSCEYYIPAIASFELQSVI